MAQSDRSNSIWHIDIITLRHSWLALSCISSQWACCSTFKYLASVCCSSSSVLQKLSTFPSSTCIDLLWGDHVSYGGYSYMWPRTTKPVLSSMGIFHEFTLTYNKQSKGCAYLMCWEGSKLWILARTQNTHLVVSAEMGLWRDAGKLSRNRGRSAVYRYTSSLVN